jgi:hypothetical protein
LSKYHFIVLYIYVLSNVITKAIINKFLDYHIHSPRFLRPPQFFLFKKKKDTKILFCVTIIIGFGIQLSIAILFTCSGAG